MPRSRASSWTTAVPFDVDAGVARRVAERRPDAREAGEVQDGLGAADERRHRRAVGHARPDDARRRGNSACRSASLRSFSARG